MPFSTKSKKAPKAFTFGKDFNYKIDEFPGNCGMRVARSLTADTFEKKVALFRHAARAAGQQGVGLVTATHHSGSDWERAALAAGWDVNWNFVNPGTGHQIFVAFKDINQRSN